MGSGSKDGKWIAFTANPPERKASKDRNEEYSDYKVYEKDYQQKQLWVVDGGAAAKGYLPIAAKQVTANMTLNINSFAWLPDSAPASEARSTTNSVPCSSGQHRMPVPFYWFELTRLSFIFN